MPVISLFDILFETSNAPLFYWWVELLFVAAIGLVFGSFSSAIIYRVPRELAWAVSGGRSQCTACGVPLKPVDLVPVLSWLANRGACRYCYASVSKLYPALEFACAVLCALVFALSSGDVYAKYALIIAVPFLLSLVMIDLRHHLLPNQLVLILAVIGAVYLALDGVMNERLIPVLLEHGGGALLFALFALALGAIMKFMLKKEALGMGDVKFFAVAGLWLGAPYLSLYCILSGLFGVALGVVWKYRFKKDIFPFGPALIASFFVILLLDGSFLFEKIVHYLTITPPS